MANNNTRLVTISYDCYSTNCIKTTFEAISKLGFSYLCCPIAHPLFRRDFYGECKSREGPFTRSDLCLTSYDWAAVIGKVSWYINCDSSNEYIRKSSEATLKQELSYAAHNSLASVIVPIKGTNICNLARILLSQLSTSASAMQIWIKVPLSDTSFQHLAYSEDELCQYQQHMEDTWVWWNKIRLMTDSHKRIGVVLEVGADLPHGEVVQRWLGEPLRAIILPTTIFVTNKRNYPVLTKPHQALVKAISQLHDVNYIITGACRHASIDLYHKYIGFLVQKMPTDDPLVTYTEGYEDFLQYPLQPLADNLESQTYEVFEKDPVKYNRYQEAIYQALVDRVPLEEKDTKTSVVMVVGAGRGPLVTATLNAAKHADRKVKVYAVEKNPNAIVTLQMRKEEEWSRRGVQVTVVSSDMRQFHPPELADIIVSELLGSFGDNELSPECLDGAKQLMKADAISIPASYTSYLVPIQSMRLHNEVKGYKERLVTKESHFEMPYVVHQKNKFTIAEPQTLFTFHHPNQDKEPDNSRYSKLSFEVNSKCLVHGFAGYFSTVLYKDITLSILPETHSPGMFSWFPIYFPIKEPVHLNAGDELEVEFWRLIDKEKVWYEWCISEPTAIPIHNTNGRSYSIKLH